MAEPGALDYFYGTEAEQYTFYRIPKVLFTDPGFRRITADAKILYGLMLDRMGLSIRNGWLDEQERVFIYFTLEEAMDAMCCGHNKAVSLFTELDKVGLIERKKQGQGRPTKIYVKNFIRKEEVKTSENRKSALPESGTLDFRKSDTINTNKNKTDLSDTDPSIYPAVRPSEDRPPTAADTMDTIRAYPLCPSGSPELVQNRRSHWPCLWNFGFLGIMRCLTISCRGRILQHSAVWYQRHWNCQWYFGWSD